MREWLSNEWDVVVGGLFVAFLLELCRRLRKRGMIW